MIHFEKFTLDNGLRVVVYRDKTTSVAAFNVLYNVGSRNELPNKTGFAHLFEHLMFGGSKNVAAFDTVLQKAGGESNAFTCSDYTNFYLTIPKQNLETAFYLESDRMNELAFSMQNLATQRNVVIEEFNQRVFNQPYGDSTLLLYPLAFAEHPYGWDTIGKCTDHIANASIDEVKEFFYTYYSPDNAIVVVGGDVDIDEVKRLTIKWFGDIPRRTRTRHAIATEPLQTAKRTLTHKADVPQDALFMAYKMCGRSDDDYYATDLISDMLSNGKSSMLYVNLLKDKQLFPEVDAYIQGALDPGLFIITAKLFATTSFEQAEEAIKHELDKLRAGHFKDDDLQKVINRNLSLQLFAQTNILNIVMELAYYEWLGDAGLINSIEAAYRNVSKADIMRVASNIFDDERLSCLYYKGMQK